MARRVANAFDTINFTHVLEQHREVCRIALWRHTPISIDILSEQRHLFDALIGELRNFYQNINERTRDFLTAGIRHHTVRAVL